jgi:NADH-quinone oxidoreductase subunit M
MPKLMWLFIIPFLASIVAFIFPSISGKNFKRLAVAMSLLPLVILLSFGINSWIGDRVAYAWLPTLSIEFYLRVDSLSLLFLYLTAIIIPISLLAIQGEDLPFPNTFYGFILLLQGLLIGFFAARDLVLFAIFWEAMLFPIYFLITLWGKAHRKRAALKFLIYMIAGSALMIAAVLALYLATLAQGIGTFSLDTLSGLASHIPYAAWLCAIFVLAFSVKTPLFPFHGWLPDVYYQASTPGTILLSALLSKAGIYGFLRIGLGLFHDILKEWSPVLLGLAIAGVLYGGLAAWMQSDYKRLIAYSSFSHVNFILAGIFVWSQAAHEGAILQALNHGVTITGLFLVAGWLEERLGSTAMGPYSGVAKFLPQLCWLTMVFVLSSVALPGTNNFIGELLILFGLFGQHPWLTFILGLTVILSVIYMLRWMQSVYFETPRVTSHLSFGDIRYKELSIALPLVALIFWIGIYPDPVLQQVIPAAGKDISIVQDVEES